MASLMALVTEVWFRQPSPVSLLALDGSGAGSGSSQSGKGKFFWLAVKSGSEECYQCITSLREVMLVVL